MEMFSSENNQNEFADTEFKRTIINLTKEFKDIKEDKEMAQ